MCYHLQGLTGKTASLTIQPLSYNIALPQAKIKGALQWSYSFLVVYVGV